MSWILALVAAAIMGVRGWMLWQSRAQRTWRWWLAWSVPSVAALVMLIELGGLRSLLELEKLIGALLMPAALVWLGIGALAVVAAARAQRRLAWALLALFILDGCAGNAWIGAALMASLERGTHPLDPAAPAFDALVVLGGGTDAAPDGRAQVVSGGDRVVIAAELFQAGKAASLAATGSSVPGMEHQHDSATETAAIWRALGVPEEAIVPLVGPKTTSQEALRVKAEAATRGWRRIGLVTSAWHMRRAKRLFEAAGVEVTPIPCDFRGDIPPWSLVWLVPHDRGFVKVQLACWEYLGALVGR